ncbi:MAG: efflux RND transporter permease subunit [Candidatus Hydrogenedentes bacterium]|nr:efflux RND transporter permease subunit [Candidatus Hydrogenedentota bacterium]
MSLLSAPIRRPVAVACVVIGLSLLGLNVYRKMPLEFFPRVDMPYVTVITVYPGGSPLEIETDIAKRIEDVVVAIDGLKHVSSVCMDNVCQTFLEFNLNVDVDVAANDVREKIDLILNDLPSGCEKPKILKFDVNAQPIINLALKGRATLEELRDYAANTLKDRLTVISGVAEVQVIGGAEREVQVLLDRDKLAARGLSSMQIVEAIQKGIRTVPSGRVREDGIEYTVKFDAEYQNVDEIGDLELVSEDGSRCYLKDVATVRMTTAELRQASYIDGVPCIGIRVVKKADANAVQVVDAVRAAVARLNTMLPGDMELEWISDDAKMIQASVDSAVENIVQGILLTALILFLFLYNLRTTIIVAVSMPVTILVGVFCLTYWDYSLNFSTLMAAGLSVGILVTNSIVVLESIVTHFNRSGNPKEASIQGASGIAVAVVASAGTNLVVLFPVAAMKSQIGMFLAPFAVVMILMTAASLFVSFTLTPLLSAVLLKPAPADRKGLLRRVEAVWNRGFDRFSSWFGVMLDFFERRRWAAVLVLVLALAAFLHAMWLTPSLGFDFFPEEDGGEIVVKLEFPTHYDLDRTIGRVKDAERLLSDLPEVQKVFTTVGKAEGIFGRSSEGVYLGQLLMVVSDKTDRDISINEIMDNVRARLASFPDCLLSVSQPTAIGGTSSEVELEIAGESLDVLDALALKSLTLVNGIPGFADPDTTVRPGKPELRVRPNRAVLSDLDIPATGVGLTLRANLEGIDAGVYKQGDRNYDIVVKMQEQEGKDQVEQFLFPGPPGRPLLLTSLASVEETRAPIRITRKDKERISKLFSNLEGWKPLGNAVMELSAALGEKGEFPPGYRYRFSGLYEIMQEANMEFISAFVIAFILVYLTLAALLESFKQPFIILLTVPLGFIGVIWALYLTGNSVSMAVSLGAVMLIGIVVNNAILIIDEANAQVAQGIPRHQAMERAAASRLRPIVMITLAAVLGMLPLAVDSSLGSEPRVPLGIASIGGILISAVLTLVVIPVVYNLFTRRSK